MEWLRCVEPEAHKPTTIPQSFVYLVDEDGAAWTMFDGDNRPLTEEEMVARRDRAERTGGLTVAFVPYTK